MNTQPSPRIIGAFLIGFALVGGAYVVANFGKAPVAAPLAQTAAQNQTATIRTAIAVTDKDDNGIADWQDEFIGFEAVVVNATTSSYETPQTITGRMGIDLVQDLLLSQQINYRGDQKEQISQRIINKYEPETLIKIYDTPDIKLIRNSNDKTVYTYANTLATAILINNQTDLENELYILQDALNRNDPSRTNDLKELAQVYRTTRDAIVDIPVPLAFAKEHLDIINGMHAMQHNIESMSLAYEDPAYSLLRLQRYEGDMFGMVMALENMYLALEPHANLFSVEDPAVFFVEFSPTKRIRI